MGASFGAKMHEPLDRVLPRAAAVPAIPSPEPLPQRKSIVRAAMGIGLYAGAFGATFGAVSAAAGLTLAQSVVLSSVMFTGASQFAFVGIVGAGGSPFAAIPAALLLGVRNAFYGVPVSSITRPRGLARLWTAQLVIDETTAMAVAQRSPTARRYAFWATGSILFVLWNAGTITGAVLGANLDPAALGLDAAAPAVFLALLWPQLKTAGAPALALAGAGVAAILVPIAPAGVPVIVAAVVAVAVGFAGSPAADEARAGGRTGACDE
jgi:predicted branched-subunit amino acid permease